jgi:translation initiation factor 2 subunit 3
MNINILDIQKNQPLVTVSTYGCVANGKSSLIKFLTGINPMKFKKEMVKNMTIKLGYTNAKIYKCSKCESPKCYQINKENCIYCEEKNDLLLHLSFIDAPGHNDLQTTALKSIDLVDFCLLLFSVEGKINNIATNEHYNAIKYFDLIDKSFILQNKIDLISKDLAIEHYELIKKNYEIETVVPISAQYGYGINYLIQMMIEKINIPNETEFNEKINYPLKATIIRSFDINKQNIDIDEVTGAVIGVHIKKGMIKIGDEIKIIPGLIMKDGTAKSLTAIVNSIKTDENEVNIAYAGGLFGIGLSLDSTLSKNNKLEGNFITNIDNNEILQFNNATIDLNNKKHKFNIGETVVLMIGSLKRNIKIIRINKEKITFESKIPICGNINDKILISSFGKVQSGGIISDIKL